MFTQRVVGFAAVLTVSSLGILLTGCGLGDGNNAAATQIVSPTVPAAVPGRIAGNAHGGQQPVSGAFVTLWAAGTSAGYGQGASSLATTTTDANGDFAFNIPSNASPCTTGQYLYITAAGGNPGGGANTHQALMLALPQACNATTGSLYVQLNEISTIAAVWSLQQFISVTPANAPYTATSSAAPWQIGAPSSNVVGLQNAFSQTAQLVNITTGLSSNSIVSSTVTAGSTPTTYYTVITPDSSRITLLADIIATCVNSNDTGTGAASIMCANLFSDVSPSGAVLPTDTIQAAYDIATAPGGITEYARAGTSATIPAGTALNSPAGSCTTVGCTWALAMCDDFVTSTPPFPAPVCTTGSATTQTYPTDFSLGIRWVAYDSNSLTYGIDQGNAAVDSNGNVWTGNTSSTVGTGAPLLEWDPQGHVLQTVSGTFNMPSETVNVYETTTGNVLSTTATPFTSLSTTTATIANDTNPFTVYGLAIDTNNNAWATASLAGTVGTAITGFIPGMVLKTPSATVTATSYSSSPTSAITADSVTAGVGTFTCVNSFAVGQSVVLAGMKTNTSFNGETVTVLSASGTQFTAAVTGTFTASDTSGYAAVAPTAATSTAATPAPYVTGSNPQSIAIDSSNNVWLNSQATSASGRNLMLMTASSSYLNLYENYYEGTNGPEQIVIDGLNNYAWGFLNASGAGRFIYRSSLTTASAGPLGSLLISSATTNGYDTSPVIINPRWGAIDNANNVWIGEGTSNSGQLAYFTIPLTGFGTLPASDVSPYIASPITTTYVANTAAGGMDSPQAISIDGAGNVFVGNAEAQTAGGVSEFAPSGTALSPTNTSTGMPAFGFNGLGVEKPQAMAIDRSGNVWMGAGASAYNIHMVGTAAPVMTPMSSATTPATAAISAWAIGSPATVATFTVANSFTVGEKVLLSGFGTSTFFNGQTVLVTAATSTTFTATVTGGTANTGATESGVVAYSKLATRP